MKRFESPWVLLCAAVFMFGGACASRPRQAAPVPVSSAGAERAVADALPVDPRITVGRLENGLTYFIRPHGKPEKRASLRLVINAGSVLETEAQRGFAHFVEHMVFNGTRQFGKQAMVNLIEKTGMRFGQHANATTGFDETVYMLEIPTDDPQMVAKSFLMLRELASEALFDADEVKKERGVIIEEWRLGRGADARVMDKQLPVIFKGSRYAERLPIGRLEILEKASADDLRRFYRDWYRPDLMAIVAAGDFDPAAIQRHIREHFGSLKAVPQAIARPNHPVPDHEQTLVAVDTDKELPYTTVALLHKLPARGRATRADYRRMVLENLYHGMLNARLAELSQTADPPFLGAMSTTQPFVRAKDVFAQMAVVKKEAVLRGMTALVREVERVDRHGFTTSELDRAKAQSLREMESAVVEKDNTPAPALAAEVIRHFLTGEAMPGIERELDLLKALLPGISIEEVNRLAQVWISERNRVILVSGPDSATMPKPNELLAVFKQAQDEAIAAYIDRTHAGPLVPQKPTPGTMVREKEIPEIGVTEWRLSNGVTVVLRPTEFKNDEVLLSALSPGGHSRVGSADYLTAIEADQLVGSSGLGTLGPVQLRKALSGKMVRLEPEISELEEGFSGGASPADLETLLQLVYLSVTAPRTDQDVFASWQSSTRELLSQRQADPQTVFLDRFHEVLFGNHPRRRPPVPANVDKVRLARALTIYKDRFRDAGDFTFLLVGRLDLEQLRPLVLTYLGGLPAKGRKESWRDIGVRLPNGVKTVTVRKGVEPKSMVRITFTGTHPWSREAEHDLESLTEALTIRLREVIREDLSGSYGVSVAGHLMRRPRETYRIDISFGCDPKAVDKLVKAVFDELETARNIGIAAETIGKVKSAQTRAREIDLKRNVYWLRALEGHYRFGTDPRLILKDGELIERLDAPLLKAAARRLLPRNRYVQGVLTPQDDVRPAAARY